ncbi:hypothetical protein [Dietzia timorensis]|uniref:Uncharacterized protein n=1 Tax=Dietzia timorensis TaxID=499555 RepID=A0A173LMJ4_9ACTN|nr:hypothetical protein [Dietzia timorensis]ANI91790.1 Hypothetical protein BJL86_0997 [Dietzia timorensis]
METKEQKHLAADAALARDFDYECAISGIRITLGPGCVPIALYVPPDVFGRRMDDVARILVTAFADASAACQSDLGSSMGDTEDTEDLDDFDDPVDGVGWPDAAEGPLENAPGRLDVEECLGRLHTVANCLTRSHHELLTSTSMGTDPSSLVHATANSSGAITALTLSPLLASEGIVAAQRAIVSAAAAAITTANDSRASVIEDALGTVLMNSLAQKWN